MTTTPITVDRASPVPLYFQVAGQIEDAIVSGRLPAGERISNEIDWAQQLGLSRPTMRQAIQVLVDKGLLVRKRGVGTQVVRGRVHRPLELTSLFDDLSAADQVQETRVLVLERAVPDAAAASELQLADGEEAWLLERLRWVGGEPLAHMCNVIPCRVADLSAVDFAVTGLYQTLRDQAVVMRVARQQISARRAEPGEAQLLGEEPGAPLLTMQRTAYDDAGRAVEYGVHAYRPELYSFDSTLVSR